MITNEDKTRHSHVMHIGNIQKEASHNLVMSAVIIMIVVMMVGSMATQTMIVETDIQPAQQAWIKNDCINDFWQDTRTSAQVRRRN